VVVVGVVARVAVAWGGAWTVLEVGAGEGADDERAEEEPNMRDKVLVLFTAGFCA
jgi:hypothetical protein